MIRKHIDLIALGVLLGGLALYSQARNCIFIELHTIKGIRFVPHPSRSMVVPPLPRIAYSKD